MAGIRQGHSVIERIESVGQALSCRRSDARAQNAIREIGTFTGTLLPKSQYVVAPKIAGRLEKLFVNIGDPVERGQVIALIDDDEFVQQVDQARAELDVARANTEETPVS